MEIHEALLALDTKDDTKWTSEGLPRVEFVTELVGRQLTRKEITDAAPFFTRDNPIVEEMTKDEKLEVMEEKTKEASIEVAEATDKEAEAANKREAAQMKLAKTMDEKAKLEDPPHVKNQKRIMAWIEGQKRERARRAAARNQLLGDLGDAGVKLEDLDPRAPIDKAYAGGQKRPEGG